MLPQPAAHAATATDTATATGTAAGWQLWVDRVGGYRLVTGPRLTIGGPGGTGGVDLAVGGRWPSQAGSLQRSADGDWLLTTSQPGGPATPLGDQESLGWLAGKLQRWTAAAGPQLVYRRPTPLSRSAVLSIPPPHRLLDPLDAVIWFQDSLLLGPEPHNHVCAPSLSSLGLVIYRRPDPRLAADQAEAADQATPAGQSTSAGQEPAAAWWIRGRRTPATRLTPGQVWRQDDWSLMMKVDSDDSVRGGNQ